MTLGAPRPSRRMIAMTPLIDVVFNLLLFFLLASSLVEWRSVGLALPPRDAVAAPDPRLSEIRLTADGGIALDGMAMTLPELEVRAREHAARDPLRPFVIRPADGVTLQPVVSVLDRLTAAGARRVSVAEEREP